MVHCLPYLLDLDNYLNPLVAEMLGVPHLQALLDKDEAAVYPLHELRSAREELQHLVDLHLCAWLLPGVGASTRTTEADSLLGAQGTAELLDSLRVLEVAWGVKHGSARLVVNVARYLPQELTALLQLLHAPTPHSLSAESAESTWCQSRLASLLRQQEPLSLLEAIAPLLRHREAPAWLRSACTKLLSECVMRSGGVDALFTCMSGQGAHQPAGTLAVKLVSSVPKTHNAGEYLAVVVPQLFALIDQAPRGPTNGPDERGEEERRRANARLAAESICSLVRRHPQAARPHFNQGVVLPIHGEPLWGWVWPRGCKRTVLLPLPIHGAASGFGFGCVAVSANSRPAPRPYECVNLEVLSRTEGRLTVMPPLARIGPLPNLPCSCG